MHFRGIAILLTCCLAAPAHAAEETWSGYLWTDAAGQTRIGWPVIAMGVMARPQNVVGKELAGPLKSFVNAVDGEYFFWNYSWLDDSPKARLVPVQTVPRVLVHLRGEVKPLDGKAKLEEKQPFGFPRTDLLMTQGRVVAVEFLNEEWLKSWQTLSRLGFRFGYLEGEPSEARIKELAPRVLVLLQQMHIQSEATPAQRAAVAQIDKQARVVRYWQTGVHEGAQRWLLEVSKKHRLELPGLADLGPLPPERERVQQLFLASATKKTFLDSIRAEWSGSLDAVVLPYYQPTGPDSISYAEARLDVVAEAWSEADFAQLLRTTKDILKK